MNIVNIEGISKIYGEKVIFKNASFGIQKGDKIGIVGINGTGKTTLLQMVYGSEFPDSGNIVRQNGLKIAFLTQNPQYEPEDTVESFALMGNPDEDWKVQSNLTQLGILDYDMKMEDLSGGQKRRVAMAKVLASEFDLLLLDEPTNHLDEEMITWLEEYLRGFRGTIMMVTHDRFFLDRVSNRILEISRGSMYGYPGNYSTFLESKAQREEMEMASERKRQSILRMEIEWAKRGCRARTTKQKARLERLDILKNTAAPVSDQTVELGSIETRMGKKTIELHGVSKAYDGKTMIDQFEYIFLKNQNVGFVGANGCGKSTLLNMIAGEVIPDSGVVEIGETIKIGYFSQEEQEMNDNQRVIDYVKDIAEYVKTKDGTISASAMLERFLFTPDMQYAPIGKLSGGEKRRLHLLGVLCQEVNVLILDEPGNNLDIPTLTILEDFLTSFIGIVITVSHDRYFLDNVVDRIFAFEGNGKLRQYEGGYSDYLAERTTLQTSVSEAPQEQKEKTYKKKSAPKLKFSFKEQREFETIDDDIANLEEKIEKLEDEILKNSTNSYKLAELMQEKEEVEQKLEEKMERWVYLNELNDRINAIKS